MRNLDKDTEYHIGKSFTRIVYKGKSYVVSNCIVRGKQPEVSDEILKKYWSFRYWDDMRELRYADFGVEFEDLFHWEQITPKKIRKYLEENITKEVIKPRKHKKEPILRNYR